MGSKTTDPATERERVIAKLREHEAELKGTGIAHLSLFGSKARGDDSAESDVDLMADFDAEKQFSLLDMVSMENRLADILNMPVDLAPAKSLKDGVRERAIREALLDFWGRDRWLRDIVDAVETVEQFTAGMDFEAFREDPKTVAAVERKLADRQ